MSQTNLFEHGKIVPINIRDEMKRSYIDYAMSVIVSRALPDVRDGLKPVHRRILYSMHEDGITSDKPYRKCANTVGSVLGRYHPHGDSSVYDAMVRLAQDFSMRYMLIDGHGNFGSIDGDGAAAMRYTESRMSKIAEQMLVDIEKNTVDFMPNYDDRLQEPTVLPSKIPALLINGSSGIAVGMATNIPPHNLSEVIDGCVAYIDNPDIELDGLMQHIKGPDFPTGATILGNSGIRKAYETGRGSITIRSKAQIEEKSGKQYIIIDEVPYGINTLDLKNKVAEFISETISKTGEYATGLLDKFKANIIAIFGFMFSVILANIVSDQPLDNIFTKDITTLAECVIVGSFVYLVICYLQSCYEIQKVYDGYNQLKQNYNEILTEDDLHEIFGNDEILITMKKTISKSKKIYLGIWILFLIGALIVVEYLSSSPNTQYIIDFIKRIYMSVCMNNKA